MEGNFLFQAVCPNNIHVYVHIQGVPRVKVTTSGECSLC